MMKVFQDCFLVQNEEEIEGLVFSRVQLVSRNRWARCSSFPWCFGRGNFFLRRIFLRLRLRSFWPLIVVLGRRLRQKLWAWARGPRTPRSNVLCMCERAGQIGGPTLILPRQLRKNGGKISRFSTEFRRFKNWKKIQKTKILGKVHRPGSMSAAAGPKTRTLKPISSPTKRNNFTKIKTWRYMTEFLR